MQSPTKGYMLVRGSWKDYGIDRQKLGSITKIDFILGGREQRTLKCSLKGPDKWLI